MNRRKRLLVTPMALIAVRSWGTGHAAQPTTPLASGAGQAATADNTGHGGIHE